MRSRSGGTGAATVSVQGADKGSDADIVRHRAEEAREARGQLPRWADEINALTSFKKRSACRRPVPVARDGPSTETGNAQVRVGRQHARGEVPHAACGRTRSLAAAGPSPPTTGGLSRWAQDDGEHIGVCSCGWRLGQWE